MNTKNNTSKELLNGLKSDKESIIIETIKQLYDTGTVDLLPYLFRLYFVTRSEDIKYEVLELLNNLKDKSACPYFVDAINSYKGHEMFHHLISCCWQNGLDFSMDITVFIDLIIEQDLFTAVEAFSVVEGNISELSLVEREKQVAYIRSKLSLVDDERKKLLRELIHIIENISGPFLIGLN